MSSWVTSARNNGGGQEGVPSEKTWEAEGCDGRGRGAKIMPYLWISRYWPSHSLALRKIVHAMRLLPKRGKRRDGACVTGSEHGKEDKVCGTQSGRNSAEICGRMNTADSALVCLTHWDSPVITSDTCVRAQGGYRCGSWLQNGHAKGRELVTWSVQGQVASTDSECVKQRSRHGSVMGRPEDEGCLESDVDYVMVLGQGTSPESTTKRG